MFEQDRRSFLVLVAAGLAGCATGKSTDVRLSSDGALVCAHDDTLKRMFGDEREVAAVRFDELRALMPVKGEKGKVKGLKSWPKDALRIPTFAEYLDVCERYDKVPFNVTIPL